LLSQELERLNINLKSKVEENSSLEARVRSMQQEIDSLNRKNNEYEFKITQEWQMKVSSFEQKITYYAQENEDLRKRLQEFGEANRKVSEYEGRITLLGQ
jgi:predicted  nucleic acid-binding Zn-ribbon protein